MLGTFSDVAPTAAAQNALNSLIAWLTTTYHITPNTTADYAYKNVTLNTIVGTGTSAVPPVLAMCCIV
jgi:hypothetical protein